MLDHTGIAVSDLDKSKTFYVKALGPLSISLIMEVTAEQTGDGAHAGFGKDGKPFFWIGSGGRPSGPAHFAFTAKSRDEVVAFHRAALAAGGKACGCCASRGEGTGTQYFPLFQSRTRFELGATPTTPRRARSSISEGVRPQPMRISLVCSPRRGGAP